MHRRSACRCRADRARLGSAPPLDPHAAVPGTLSATAVFPVRLFVEEADAQADPDAVRVHELGWSSTGSGAQAAGSVSYRSSRCPAPAVRSHAGARDAASGAEAAQPANTCAPCAGPAGTAGEFENGFLRRPLRRALESPALDLRGRGPACLVSRNAGALRAHGASAQSSVATIWNRVRGSLSPTRTRDTARGSSCAGLRARQRAEARRDSGRPARSVLLGALVSGLESSTAGGPVPSESVPATTNLVAARRVETVHRRGSRT